MRVAQARVERFVVEVPHRKHRGLRSVHLKHPLVEVAERLPGNGAVALRLELAAAPAWPVVAEDGAQVRAAAVVVF